MESRKSINPYIELLRTAGIFVLVLYHIGSLGSFLSPVGKLFFFISGMGWVGTDLFLAIAGYLFYNSFSRHHKNNLLSYGKNRIFRIIPSYYIFLAFYFSLGIPLENALGNHFSIPEGYWIYFITFTANIPMALGQWSGVALEGLFGISLLAQLFFLFSLLFSIMKKDSQRLKLIIILEVLVILSRFHPALRNREWFSYFFTLTRMDGFLLGILLALLKEKNKGRSFLNRNKYILFALSFSLLIIVAPMTGWLQTTHPFTSCFVFPILGLFFASLLNLILAIPASSWSFYAGDFVYSLYLVKLPLIYLIKGYIENIHRNLNKPNIFLILSLIICISWSIIFNIIHRFRKKLTKRIIKA